MICDATFANDHPRTEQAHRKAAITVHILEHPVTFGFGLGIIAPSLVLRIRRRGARDYLALWPEIETGD